MFLTVKEVAERWGISDRRVRVLCSEGKIYGAYQKGLGKYRLMLKSQKIADISPRKVLKI